MLFEFNVNWSVWSGINFQLKHLICVEVTSKIFCLKILTIFVSGFAACSGTTQFLKPNKNRFSSVRLIIFLNCYQCLFRYSKMLRFMKGKSRWKFGRKTLNLSFMLCISMGVMYPLEWNWKNWIKFAENPYKNYSIFWIYPKNK